jgi:hypothetical protein
MTAFQADYERGLPEMLRDYAEGAAVRVPVKPCSKPRWSARCRRALSPPRGVDRGQAERRSRSIRPPRHRRRWAHCGGSARRRQRDPQVLPSKFEARAGSPGGGVLAVASARKYVYLARATSPMRYLVLACDYDGTLPRAGTRPPWRPPAGRLTGRRVILLTGRELPDLPRCFRNQAVRPHRGRERAALPATEQNAR